MMPSPKVCYSFFTRKITKVIIILITMGTLVAAGVAYLTINNNKIDSSIKANPKQGIARIIDRSMSKVTSSTATNTRYRSVFKYEYEIGGVKYSRNSSYSFDIKHQDDFIGKVFSVICDEKTPKDSRLLILEKEYQEFSLQQPDGLKKYNVIFK